LRVFGRASVVRAIASHILGHAILSCESGVGNPGEVIQAKVVLVQARSSKARVSTAETSAIGCGAVCLASGHVGRACVVRGTIILAVCIRRNTVRAVGNGRERDQAAIVLGKAGGIISSTAGKTCAIAD
jgi:hypothetical protein